MYLNQICYGKKEVDHFILSTYGCISTVFGRFWIADTMLLLIGCTLHGVCIYWARFTAWCVVG